MSVQAGSREAITGTALVLERRTRVPARCRETARLSAWWPTSPAYHQEHARCLAQSGDYELAIASLGRAHALAPGATGPLIGLRNLNAHLGRYDRALRASEQLRAREPWQPGVLAPVRTYGSR